MARVHIMGGYLNPSGNERRISGQFVAGSGGPVDPGYGIKASDRPVQPPLAPPPDPARWPRTASWPSDRSLAPPGTPPGKFHPLQAQAGRLILAMDGL